MKAKFDSTKTTENIFIVLLLAMVFAVFILSFQNIMAALIPAAVFLVLVGLCLACRGEIIADENRITVVTTFFGKAVKKKIIEYADVDRTDCGVEAFGTRVRSVSYIIRLTIKMEGVSRFIVSAKMNIASSFPVEQPDKYKQYLSEQPLMKISHYIDSKLHLNTSA